MQKPSVARVVHYVSLGSADGKHTPQCRAATITEVGDNDRVGLCVQNPTGLFFHPLADGGCERHDGDSDHVDATPGKPMYRRGTWHWPERV